MLQPFASRQGSTSCEPLALTFSVKEGSIECSNLEGMQNSAPAKVEHEVVDDGDEVAGQEDSRGAGDHHNLGRLAGRGERDAQANRQDRENDDEAAHRAIPPALAWEPALHRTPSTTVFRVDIVLLWAL